MNNTISGTVEIGDGKLYYEMAGRGEALVLCHAGFVDSGMWDGQWADFSQSYRVIRFDMRDYGKSDLAQGPVSRSKDLEHLLDRLGIQRAVLLGCSLGGSLVLDFALEHPEKVDGLILVSVSPSGFQMQGSPPDNLMEMMSAVESGDLERASELQIRIWVDGPFRQPEQIDPRVRQRVAEMSRIPVAHRAWEKDGAFPLDPPAVKRLDQIRVPTLIVAGALDHPELLRAADLMEKEIRQAKKVIIAGSAHVPNMEKPADFNRAVLNFLKNAKLSANPE